MEVYFETKNKYFILKRILDVVVGIVFLIPVLVVVLFSALIVVFNDFGNPFIVQKRLGYKGREFNLLKIRTMVLNAEENGAVWATNDDHRILKCGKFMRRTRIDELPQVINIIKGDMSFIGPRPERKELAEEFLKEIPDFNDRLSVKPGLTGHAQVNGGYDLSPYDKLIYDKEYIKNISLMLDVKIFFKTIYVILTGHGAR